MRVYRVHMNAGEVVDGRDVLAAQPEARVLVDRRASINRNGARGARARARGL